MHQTTEFLPPLERALQEIASLIYDGRRHKVNPSKEKIYLGFKGSFGELLLNPRTLRSEHIGKMVCLEGIVTKCKYSLILCWQSLLCVGSLVRPKVSVSVHYCEATRLFHMKEYQDIYSTAKQITTLSSAYPTEDENGNPLKTEFGFCVFRDHQSIHVQELPESAPPGQLPRSIDVVCEDDLADHCKPGDRLLISGIYRSVGSNVGSTSATFRTVIVANNLIKISGKSFSFGKTSESSLELLNEDIKNINRISRRKDIFDLLSRSLAPSIYGHEMIKKALLLQLLGGVEKNLENGTHIRGCECLFNPLTIVITEI